MTVIAWVFEWKRDGDPPGRWYQGAIVYGAKRPPLPPTEDSETQRWSPLVRYGDVKAKLNHYRSQAYRDNLASCKAVVVWSGAVAGGLARAAALSPERRAEIARTAANARWNP